jgi:hypothetical protein
MVSFANSHPKTSRPFRANHLNGWFPGLKPWAESSGPFGADLKGQDSLTQGSPWVSLFNRARARYRPPSSSTSSSFLLRMLSQIYPPDILTLDPKSRTTTTTTTRRRARTTTSTIARETGSCPEGAQGRSFGLNPPGKTNHFQNSQLTS